MSIQFWQKIMKNRKNDQMFLKFPGNFANCFTDFRSFSRISRNSGTVPQIFVSALRSAKNKMKMKIRKHDESMIQKWETTIRQLFDEIVDEKIQILIKCQRHLVKMEHSTKFAKWCEKKLKFNLGAVQKRATFVKHEHAAK